MGVRMSTGATETVTTPAGSTAKYATWLAAVLGLWVLVSPFVLSGTIASGTPMWSSVVAGILAAVFAGYTGFQIHASGE